MNFLTTASPVGSTSRYSITVLSWIFIAVSVYQSLPAETQATLQEFVGPWGALIALIPAIATPLYGILTKSNSDKAQEVAKIIDAEVPPSTAVVGIKTAGKEPDVPITPAVK